MFEQKSEFVTVFSTALQIGIYLCQNFSESEAHILSSPYKVGPGRLKILSPGRAIFFRAATLHTVFVGYAWMLEWIFIFLHFQIYVLSNCNTPTFYVLSKCNIPTFCFIFTFNVPQQSWIAKSARLESILEDLAQTHQSVKHSIRNLVLSTLCYTISIFILVSTRTAP